MRECNPVKMAMKDGSYLFRSPEYVFKHVAPSCMAEVLSEFGYKIERRSDHDFRALSLSIEIKVAFASTSIQVTIRSLIEPINALDLYWVLEAIAPELSDNEIWPRYLKSGRAVPREIKRQLKLLVKHCRSMLEGKPDQWAIIEEWKKDWGGRQIRAGETIDDYYARLRHCASNAWNHRNYWRTSDLYARIAQQGGKLSLREKTRLRYAKLHTFTIF